MCVCYLISSNFLWQCRKNTSITDSGIQKGWLEIRNVKGKTRFVSPGLICSDWNMKGGGGRLEIGWLGKWGGETVSSRPPFQQQVRSTLLSVLPIYHPYPHPPFLATAKIYIISVLYVSSPSSHCLLATGKIYSLYPHRLVHLVSHLWRCEFCPHTLTFAKSKSGQIYPPYLDTALSPF